MRKIFFFFLLIISFTPFANEQGAVTPLNGVDIWWQAHGDKSDPPVLLIMGINSNSKLWPQDLIDGLVKESFYVITYDNRDTGKSSWVTSEPIFIKIIKILPDFVIESFVDTVFDFMFNEEGKFNMEEVPSEYNLSDMAKDGLSILDYLAIEKAHIVGASLGGMIAQIIAIDHPNRALSLTAIMTTPGFDTEGLSGPSPIFKQAMKESFVLNLQGMEKEALKISQIALTGSRFPFNEEAYEKRFDEILSHGNNTSSGHMAAVGASPNRFNRLGEIDLNTLIIHGAEDPLIPVDHGISLFENINNSEKMILDGVGHEIPDELLSEIVAKLKYHFNKGS